MLLRMNFEQARKRLVKAKVPDVHKLTGIPLRTLYRIKSSKVVPKYATAAALIKWASK